MYIQIDINFSMHTYLKHFAVHLKLTQFVNQLWFIFFSQSEKKEILGFKPHFLLCDLRTLMTSSEV